MTFAAALDAPVSDSRSSRLAFATVVVCSGLALACMLALVLERMVVKRVAGPRTRIEFAAAAIADPPKPVEPPERPREVDPDPDELAGGAVRTVTPAIVEDAKGERAGDEVAGEVPGKGIPGPSLGGSPCLGPMCGKPAIPGLPSGIGTGTCIGPHCKTGKAKPPAPLSLDAMQCLACPDPSDAALRKTVGGRDKRGGTNVTSFCVDERGRVEADSISTRRSHGDPTIDRLCREAVAGWRYSPTKVDGQARRACSEATFRIRFE